MIPLPHSSPVCVHDWEYMPHRHAHICSGCGFVITDFEMELRPEGWNVPKDDPDGPSVGADVPGGGAH